MVQNEEEKKARRMETTRIWKENNEEYWAEYKKKYNRNNKEKIAEKAKEYRQNNKEKLAEMKQNYDKTPAGKKVVMMAKWRSRGVKNVTDEMYNNYIATTYCECCLKEFSSSRDRHLDHDHETGEFRWVICHACNTHDSWKKKINIHQAV